MNNTMYMAASALDSEKLAIRHMWQFRLKLYKNICPSAGFIVTHIVPMYEYELKYNNVLFVLDILKPDKKTNCCFSEFLSSGYVRECGKAFESLNTEMIRILKEPVTLASVIIGKSWIHSSKHRW